MLFWITCGIYIIGWLVYVCLADIRLQEWAKGKESDEKNEVLERLTEPTG
jgi:hypothetical protein